MRYQVTWLDVFASRPLSGNQLAVVHDADDLRDDVMLAVARETRLSETTFVQTATRAGADYRNRIFSPSGELPFAGHPSLGTAVAVARVRGQARARYVQQTPAGLQPVDVRLDGAAGRAAVLQEPAVFGGPSRPAPTFSRRRPCRPWPPIPTCRRKSSPPACRTSWSPFATPAISLGRRPRERRSAPCSSRTAPWSSTWPWSTPPPAAPTRAASSSTPPA